MALPRVAGCNNRRQRADGFTGPAAGWSAAPDGVLLPRLHLSQTQELTSTLAELGLPLNGDYSGLGAADTQIDQVVQQAALDVDENGTTAAAATGATVAVSAKAPRRTITFDRSFLLLLRDTSTRTPLFLARITDPS